MTYARKVNTAEAWRVSDILRSEDEYCPAWLFLLVRRGFVTFRGAEVSVCSKTAEVGDWIVYEPHSGFVTVFTDEQFKLVFEQLPEQKKEPT